MMLRSCRQSFVAFAYGLLIAVSATAAPSTTTLTAAAVASPDRYGALAAQSILRAGGNAVDAAVATARLPWRSATPKQGNIRWRRLSMTLFAIQGQACFLDYRETAPAGASANMYLDSHGEQPTENSLYGNLAVGIPGTVRGMAEAHRRFGKLTWQQDLAPAIELARTGFVVPADLIKTRQDSHPGYAHSGNFAAWACKYAQRPTFSPTRAGCNTPSGLRKTAPTSFTQGRPLIRSWHKWVEGPSRA